MSSPVSRRAFTAAMLAAAVFPGNAFGKRADSSIDGFDLIRTAYDPTDFDSDPLLVKPMPVRVGEKTAYLHLVAVGPAELKLDIRPRNASKHAVSSVIVPGGVHSLFIPLAVMPGITYEWSMYWRGSRRAPWRSTGPRVLKTLSWIRRESKIVIVGDTHSLIEGLIEQDLGTSKCYDVLSGFYGRMFETIRALEPDLVVFCGDDTGLDGNYIWKQKGIATLAKTPLNVLATMEWRLWRQILTRGLGGISAVQVLGNHDGFKGFTPECREWSAVGKKFYFPNPDPGYCLLGGENNGEVAHLNFITRRGGGSPFENYFGVRIGPLDLFALDILGYTDSDGAPPLQPQQWTYGEKQLEWLARGLAKPNSWKMLVTHHLAGGNPRGPHGEDGWIAYGRGGVRYAGEYEQARVHRMLCSAVAAGQGAVHVSAHDHNWWHGQADPGFNVGYVERGGQYINAIGPTYLGAGTPSHLPTWSDLSFNDEMYEGRDIAGKGIVLVTANDERLNARYIKVDEAGAYFDGKPAREMRTSPDTPIGGLFDSISIVK